MWATETLQLCRSLIVNVADIWEQFIWSENVCSEDIQPTDDRERPEIHNEDWDCESIYKAHPLSQPNSIRVLNILPSTCPDMTDDISCCLSVISLDPPPFSWAFGFFELDISLDYRAVSYVCVPSSVTRNILIDDKRSVVRANLWDFLAEARREKYTGSLWMDAICINQEDIEERSSQVANMGLVNSKATCVWAWLGLGTERQLWAFQDIALVDWPADVQRTGNGWKFSAIEQYFESVVLLLDLEYWWKQTSFRILA
jgi:hypothetical protein